MIIKHKKYSDLILPENYLEFVNNTIINKTYDCFSTCVLITNTNNMYNLIDYIYWHLNICNFNKILIFSNNNSSNINNIKNVIKLFNTNRIDFEVNNSPLYEIHNEVLKTVSSKYIMFIDDDEYLYISDKYTDINDLLKNKENDNIFKFSVNWVHFFNNVLVNSINYETESCLSSFKYYYNKIIFKDIRFNLIKTIYKTNIEHKIFSDNSKHIKIKNGINSKSTVWNEVKPGTLHNALTYLNKILIPSHNLSNNTLNYNYDNSLDDDISVDNCDIYLAHYKYISYKDIKNKLSKSRDYVSIDPISYNINYNKDLILKLYNTFNDSNCILCNDLFNVYNKYKNDILNIKKTYKDLYDNT